MQPFGFFLGKTVTGWKMKNERARFGQRVPKRMRDPIPSMDTTVSRESEVMPAFKAQVSLNVEASREEVLEKYNSALGKEMKEIGIPMPRIEGEKELVRIEHRASMEEKARMNRQDMLLCGIVAGFALFIVIIALFAFND